MPLVVRCAHCNYVFYSGSLESVSYIISLNNSVCPRCKRKLSPDSMVVSVKELS